jgi:hypothetical protein
MVQEQLRILLIGSTDQSDNRHSNKRDTSIRSELQSVTHPLEPHCSIEAARSAAVLPLIEFEETRSLPCCWGSK